MAYPLRRPWLFRLKKTNIKNWKDVDNYQSKPSLQPQFYASLFPFLILYFKMNRLNSFTLKKKLFYINKLEECSQKCQYYKLILLICSNRILVLFFFKLNYLWLKEVDGLFLENQVRLWIIFLMFLKLNFKKYLFGIKYFNRVVIEEVAKYEQFKWRVSLGNFFSFGRYIEYVRRIKYNEYLANMYNEYSGMTRIHRISQFWINYLPEALAIDYKFRLIDVLENYCIYFRFLAKDCKYLKEVVIKDKLILNFSLLSVQLIYYNKFKKIFLYLFFALSVYCKPYIIRAINLSIYSLKIWLCEWTKFRYKNIKLLFQSLRLYYRRILIWLKNYCIMAMIRNNFALIHTSLFIYKNSIFINNIMDKCDLVVVDYISSLYILWFRWLQKKRRTRNVTYVWRVLFHLIKMWYHVIVVDLVNFYEPLIFNYILKLVKYNVEYIWWRVFFAGNIKKRLVSSDKFLYDKYAMLQKNLYITKMYQFNYIWIFFKKKDFRKKKFIVNFFFQQVLFDFIIYFFSLTSYSLVRLEIYNSFNILYRLLIWVRRFEWFRLMYNENLYNVHYYIEPFERLLDEIYFLEILALILIKII